MEVHQQLLPGGRRPFSDLHRGGNITISAAEAVSVRVPWIVPDPDADGIDSILRQYAEQVRLVSVKIVVFDAAVFLGNHAGNVHAENKIFRQVLHFFHIQCARLLRTGMERKRHQHNQRHQ